MPKRGEGRDRGRDQQEEWEPSGALTDALKGVSLLPGAERDVDLARLEPHAEEALGTLERLERRRDLSEREKARMGALRMLLASIERDR